MKTFIVKQEKNFLKLQILINQQQKFVFKSGNNYIFDVK